MVRGAWEKKASPSAPKVLVFFALVSLWKKAWKQWGRWGCGPAQRKAKSLVFNILSFSRASGLVRTEGTLRTDESTCMGRKTPPMLSWKVGSALGGLLHCVYPM